MNKFCFQKNMIGTKNQFYNLSIKRGDIILIEYYTEGKYHQIFNGVCVDVLGTVNNRRIKLFNLDEKIESIFFLNSPNIIKLKILNNK